MEKKQYKILVLVMSAYGHLNPIASFVSELAKNKNLKIIFYGNQECQKIIENTKAEFRSYNHSVGMLDLTPDYSRFPLKFPMDKFMDHLLTVADIMLEELVRTVEEEEIDLIINDFATMYATWLKEIVNKRYEAKLLKRPCPPTISFWSVFVFKKNVFPNLEEKKYFDQQSLTVDFIWTILVILYKYVRFCYKWGLSLTSLEDLLMYKEGERAICCIAPEIHPRSYVYPKAISFVGICTCNVQQLSRLSVLTFF